MTWARIAAVLALTLNICQAQTPDMSGTWQLNVEKSNWGKHPKPMSGVVTIEHHEPAFRYSGTVAMQNGAENGEDPRTFSFEGAIDGKEYPVTGTSGEGKLTIRRLSPNTISSELKSPEGTIIETAKTTVSADGKKMVREMRSFGPSGAVAWTEIYERR